jgi:hypothetical protein
MAGSDERKGRLARDGPGERLQSQRVIVRVVGDLPGRGSVRHTQRRAALGRGSTLFLAADRPR